LTDKECIGIAPGAAPMADAGDQASLLLGLRRAARPAELVEQPHSFCRSARLPEIIGGLLRQQIENVQISLVGR